VDWARFLFDAEALFVKLKANYYIKSDLRAYVVKQLN